MLRTYQKKVIKNYLIIMELKNSLNIIKKWSDHFSVMFWPVFLLILSPGACLPENIISYLTKLLREIFHRTA